MRPRGASPAVPSGPRGSSPAVPSGARGSSPAVPSGPRGSSLRTRTPRRASYTTCWSGAGTALPRAAVVLAWMGGILESSRRLVRQSCPFAIDHERLHLYLRLLHLHLRLLDLHLSLPHLHLPLPHLRLRR